MVDIQHTDLTGSGQLHPPLAKTFTGAAASYTPDNADELVVKTDVTPHILYRTTGVLAGDVIQIGIVELISDTTPQLGGDLDVNGQSIVSASNGDIILTPDGSGRVILDGLSYPDSDGTNGQVITTDGAGNLTFTTAAGGGGLANVVEDLTPQLGGNLDVNGQSIVSVSAGNIAITPDTTGSIVLDGLNWPQADGTSSQVLTTDGAGNLSFTSAAGGLANVVEDITPQLGGDLDVNGQSIVSVSAGNISITPDTTGRVVIDGLNYPDADGTNGQAITTDGAGNLSFTTVSGSGISNVVEDLTPQLGGNLDVNGQSIVSVSAGNISLTPDTTGRVVLDGLSYPDSDGTNGQVLQTDGAGNLSFATPGAASSLNINYEFQYDSTTTSGDPGSGAFRLNNATVASATSLFISQTTDAGSDLSTIFDTLGSGDKIYLQNNADSTERVLLNVTAVTDNTTWYDITVTVDDSNGPTWTNLADFGLIFEHVAGGGGGGTLDTDDTYANGDRTIGSLITVTQSGNFTFVEGINRLIDDGTPQADPTGTTAAAGDWIQFELDTAQQITAAWWSVDRPATSSSIVWQASNDAISWRTVSEEKVLERTAASSFTGDNEVPTSWKFEATEPYLYYRLVLTGGSFSLLPRYGYVRLWKREVV